MSTPDAGAVRVERSTGRMSLVLDRPTARNAISPGMLDQLTRAVEDARREGPPVLTITGSGSAFCAGADIGSYRNPSERLDALESFTRAARRLCRAIETVDAIVVAGVDGPCLGGGFEIALACDLVIATDSAKFGLPETRLGLIPGWGGTQRLSDAVGARRARALILRAETFDARTAQQWGLVHHVVGAGELPVALDSAATDLLGRAPLALKAVKRSIGAWQRADSPSPGEELETRELMALFASADGSEGIAAFVEKRPPQFRGA